MRKPALVLFALVVAASAAGKGKDLRPLPGMKGDPGVLKGLKIHEWGVFLANTEEAQAAGGGAAPTFIQRVKAPSQDTEAEFDRCAKEPILHVYAPEAGTLRLDVAVSFPHGNPELAWPRARISREKGVPVLRWTLNVLKDVLTEEGRVAIPKVPEDHWISAVRKVGSDLLTLADCPDAERFLYYDGKVERPQTAVSVDRRADGYLLGSKDVGEAWVVEADPDGLKRFHDADLICPLGIKRQRCFSPTKPVSKDDLRAELAKALTAAGLSGAEAGALLTIWIPELTKPGTRLVHVLPRAEYDRLLPITFDPAPEELKRVGLVIQEIAP